MSKRDKEFGALWDKAFAAGLAAGKAAAPQEMVVTDGVKTWRVSEGVCGFAWVLVRPGNCPFANWAKKRKIMSAAYGGGVSYWVGEFNQSMARKEAMASAMAKVLQEGGVTAYAQSRMD